MSDIPQAPIQHDSELQQFSIMVEGAEAMLKYRLLTQADGVQAIDFFSTWVPESLRGQGIAERLVHEGLRWAKHQNLLVQASCWYVAKFLRH